MEPANACPRCGSARLANAPAGLCPRCLLGHGLRAGPGEEVVAAASFDRRRTSHPSGILSPLDETLGPVPPVRLRDAPAGEERPARAASEEMPGTAGDAGRYQLHGEIARGG